MGGPGGPRMFMMPRPGEVLPGPLQEMLGLTAEQKKRLAELQKETDARLDKILTDEQNKQLKEMRDRGPGGFGPPRPFDPNAPAPPRGARNFGPDAKPQKGPGSKAKKKENERPRGPIPTKFTGRSFSLDDDSPDEAIPEIDDFATSKPTDGTETDATETDDTENDDE